MCVAHQRGRRAQRAGAVARHHVRALRADAVGVRGNLAQSERLDHVRIAARIAGQPPVGRRLRGIADQLHQFDVGHRLAEPLAQRAQIGGLERLQIDRCAARMRIGTQRVDQLFFHRQPDAAEVARMLGLDIEADGPAAAARGVGGQRDDLVQRRDLELVVVLRIGRTQLRNALARAQRLELGQREVLGEPALQPLAVDHLDALALGELRQRGDVGGAADLVLVAGHQHAVARDDQIGFDQIGAVLDRLGVRRQRMFGPQRAGAAMADYQRLGSRRGRFGLRRFGGGRGGRYGLGGTAREQGGQHRRRHRGVEPGGGLPGKTGEQAGTGHAASSSARSGRL